jgi:hypothetical protein
MRFPVLNLSWHRFAALALFGFGFWLEVLLAVIAFADANSRTGRYPPGEALLKGTIGAIGFVLILLSYFISRRHNWARLAIIFVLAGAIVSIAIVLFFRLAHGGFGSVEKSGQIVLAVAFMLILLTIVLFLMNKPVADEFMRDEARK